MINSPSPRVIYLSKLISNFFNPLNSVLIYFVIYSLKNHSLEESIFNFLPIFLITIVPISGFIFWKVKKKHYTDGDVSDRHQRKSLYIFMAGSIVIYLAFIYARFQQIDFVLFFLLVLLLAMMASNYFIKSSMHIALNIFVAALLFTIDPIFGVIWMVCAILVGLSRIILKRHTIKEVMSGALIALIVSFIYLYTHIHTIN